MIPIRNECLLPSFDPKAIKLRLDDRTDGSGASALALIVHCADVIHFEVLSISKQDKAE